MKTYSVKLKLFKGEKNYNQDGSLKKGNSQNMDITPYLSMEWLNWMKNATNLGYTDADVIQVSDIVHTEYDKRDGKEVDPYVITTYQEAKSDDPIINEIKKAVKDAFDTSVKVALTPQEQKIADMEAEMAELKALIRGNTSTKKVETKKVDDTPNINEELDSARAEYKKVFKKNAHHLWKLETINEKIKAKLEE